jgi:hypothetical protein
VGVGPLSELRQDLVLLSVEPRWNRLADPVFLRYGLRGAELLILAADRRIDLGGSNVTVLSAEPTGDILADRSLATIAASRRPHGTRWWVNSLRPEIVEDYVSSLAAAGVMRADRKLLKTLHVITDPARAAQARARLDAVTWARANSDLAAAALGGLAYSTALDRRQYSGRIYRSRHQELREIGSRRWAEHFLSGPDAALAGAIASVVGAVAATCASNAAG